MLYQLLSAYFFKVRMASLLRKIECSYYLDKLTFLQFMNDLYYHIKFPVAMTIVLKLHYVYSTSISSIKFDISVLLRFKNIIRKLLKNSQENPPAVGVSLCFILSDRRAICMPEFCRLSCLRGYKQVYGIEILYRYNCK